MVAESHKDENLLTDSASVSSGRPEERINEYRGIYDDARQVVPLLDNALKFKVGYQRVGHYAHGWFMRVLRGTEAVLVLDRAGFAGEAAPLRRSIIEHCVGLQWLAADGDSIVDAVKVGHQDWARHLRRSLTGSPLLDEAHFDSVEASVADADVAAKILNKFVERANRYSTPQTLPGYFAETGQSHATYESAMAYVDPDTQEGLGSSRHVEPQIPFCAVHLVIGLTAFGQIFQERTVVDALREVQERLRLRVIEDRSENGWPIPPELLNPSEDAEGRE